MDVWNLLREQEDIPATLERLSGLVVYPRSITPDNGVLFFMGRQGRERRLGVLSAGESVPGFKLATRQITLDGHPLTLGLGELTHTNAVALRQRLPYTAPIVLGTRKSAGLGDRLGIATPGHLRAIRQAPGIAPILAQQSIREMERTSRSADQVMDDATWGVFQEGWREGFGSDADHLKTHQDIDVCVAAGFTLYTFDPRDHVDNAADADPVEVLRAKYAALPWAELDSTPEQTRQAYLGHTWELSPACTIRFTEEQLLRAACKYGRGLAHLADMYRYLDRVMGDRSYEVEVSVDETDTPTQPVEHFYIASELKRLGVTWVGLAPRYIGRFEKGVDYIGDLAEFEADFAQHAAIARALGPYKLSLHSGSDKFSIYPITARLAGDLIHLKTAGTSYLEALHAIARVEPGLFREILDFAIAHYETDKRSYHVSAELQKMRPSASLTDAELEDALYAFDTRQALHVTFGTVLTVKDDQGNYVFRDRIYAVLEDNEEAHYRALQDHFARHLTPFLS